jgi:GntR family transcriptional regulator, transcriptional repressor for pyruvate dehydrogenase complex
VEAAHNIVLLHTMRSIYELLVAGVFYDRVIYFQDDDMRHTILEQHQAILDAILAGDRSGAQAAAERHLRFIEDTLRRVERTGSRAEVSERRLEKLKQRPRRSMERLHQTRAAE